MTDKQKQKHAAKILQQLGYMRLMELAREAGASHIDVHMPGLDDYHDYMIVVKNDNARLCLVNEYDQAAVVADIEL